MSVIVSLLVALICSLFMAPAMSQNVDKIVVFGDSLSDNGNLFKLTKLLNKIDKDIKITPIVPYSNGRFSNGPVWAEYVADHLRNYKANKPFHLPHPKLEDHAYGGAWIEPVDKKAHPNETRAPDLDLQMLTFIPNHATIGRHLFVFWIGSNDFLGMEGDVGDPAKAIAILQKDVEKVVTWGGKTFLMPNLPDLGRVPYGTEGGPEFSARLTKRVTDFNDRLKAMVAGERLKYPGVKFIEVDIFNMLRAFQDTAWQDGYENWTDACYPGGPTAAPLPINNPIAAAQGFAKQKKQPDEELVCNDQSKYVFWDHMHPTTAMHQLLAERIIGLLKDAGID